MRTPAPVHRSLLAGLLVVVAGLSLAASAAAVAPGRNGRIAFTSGREGANDNNAQLYTVNPSKPTALGSPFTAVGGQSRHPSFSPDRTKVVFASGTPGTPTTEEFDLFVKDMVTGDVAPLDATQLGDGLSSDHPAWSHDGTRIAYDHQPADNSAERDIKIKAVGRSTPAADFTLNAPVEFKPAWSPDDETLYFARTDTSPAVNFNIYRKPAAGGSQTPVAADPGVDEYQPAISPDGSKICYTRQSTRQDSTSANIVVANLPGMDGAQTHSPDNTKGDINCVFSPDGRKIAYTNGTYGQGRLVTKRVGDVASQPDELADDQGSNNFDGNADWAPDGSPECPDKTVTTEPGKPITIELECADTGPAYERTDPNGFVDSRPQNGTTSDESNTTNPSTVKYTPKPGFTGTDRIVYSAFDSFGFGTDNGTVTIQVRTPRGGDAGAGGGDGRDTSRPVLRRLRIDPRRRRFAVRLSEAARLSVRVEKRRRGRYRRVRSFRRKGRSGRNVVRLGRRLARGNYRLVVGAVDGAGNRSRTARRRFRVKR